MRVPTAMLARMEGAASDAAAPASPFGEVLRGLPERAAEQLFSRATFHNPAERLWEEATTIWLDGGWAMIVIAVIALAMFGIGVHVQLELLGKGYGSVPERTWRRWIARPIEREGPIGKLLDFVLGGRSLADTAHYFEQLRKTELAPFERDLRVMRICVSAAPLVGLLGTVTGMLSTFGALASGSGGDKTMAMVAAGISEALITTETGLVIALPGLFFQYQLTRSYEHYKAFLAHLETVCTQHVQRQIQQARVSGAARRHAVAVIRERLRQNLSRPGSDAPSESGAPDVRTSFSGVGPTTTS